MRDTTVPSTQQTNADITPRKKSAINASKITSIESKVLVERACEAVIWGMPAVSVQDILAGTRRDLGGDVGDVVYFSNVMESRHGFLTANNVTPYVIATLTCKGDPLIVEVPPADDYTSYFGTFVDGWQMPIADVGPAPGADDGQGGRYLFLPPDFEGDAPSGYSLVYRPKTYRVSFAFRPVSKNGGTLDQAVEYAQLLRTYKLSEAANPPRTNFIDAYPEAWNTLPTYDISYFHDLAEVVLEEPVLERDKSMMGLLASIGIEKGKPFKPDETLIACLEQGAQRAYDWMQRWFTTPGKALAPYWEGKQWGVFNLSQEQSAAGFPFATDDRVLIDERAGGYYFWATYLPKTLGDGSFYLTTLWDKDGNLFDGKATYRLRVPKEVPAEDFWSVIAYSMESKGFISEGKPLGRSSKDDDMQFNPDGSGDVYFAPEPPAGWESNWVKTGEDFFPLFRLYGPGAGLSPGGPWILNDVEKVSAVTLKARRP